MGKIPEGQGILFPELFPEREVRVETDGPSVSLYAHTAGLYRALAQLGRISRNAAALHKEVPIPKIEETPRFRSNIEHNIDERWQDAYDGFVTAFTGRTALQGTVDPEAKVEWSAFVSRFSGPDNRAARDRYRNRLERNAKKQGWPLPSVQS
jgi:hypothetical protein